MMSKICGHRGAAYHKPENTISGFEWCVENINVGEPPSNPDKIINASISE